MEEDRSGIEVKKMSESMFLLGTPVGYRCVYGVFAEHGAMELNGRQM